MKDKDYEQRATAIIMNTIEGVKAQIRKAYNKGYKDGKADTPFTDTKDAEEKAYNRGLNEAWEAAGKLYKISSDDYSKLFEMKSPYFDFSIQEVLTKIKEYEDKQKQDDWRDIPSDEMTLEQARRAVKELRAEAVGKILAESDG